jgi:DNA ligase-associated metallophosphoesterase
MRTVHLHLPGAVLVADAAGVLVWPEREVLVVADLHLEKGSGLAARGRLLPPYDTGATLARLERTLQHWRPRTVVSLGDSFHDRRAATRLPAEARNRLCALTAAVDWIWVAGNHDPEPPDGLGGRAVETFELAGLLFRHAPDGGGAGEVAGHLHPKAAVRNRGRRLSRRCFATDGRRVVLPAFGAYTGGLNVLDPAFGQLFPAGFHAYVLGPERIHVIPHDRLDPEGVQLGFGLSRV